MLVISVLCFSTECGLGGAFLGVVTVFVNRKVCKYNKYRCARRSVLDFIIDIRKTRIRDKINEY